MTYTRRVGFPRVLGVAIAVAALGLACAPPLETPAVDRVLLIGIDGLDWRILEPAMESGRVPNLARLRDRGAAGPLATLLPTYSPIVWASVATGRGPRAHGIDFFGARDATGKVTTPYTSNSRRVKALWNIISEAERDVVVAGWWNTWPAEAVRGTLVSDRMIYTRFNLWLGVDAFGETLPRQTWPESLQEELAPLTAVSEESWRRFAERFLPTEDREGPKRVLHDRAFELYLAYARDVVYDAIARRVFDPDAAFTAFYWNGVDIASHYFYKYRFPDEWGGPIAADEVERFRDVIDAYLAFVDERIGWLLEQADERSVVMVVSDHGFRAGRRRDSPNISGIHFNCAPPGVVLMAGGPIPAGRRVEGAHVYDVAPTVLHLLGLPVGRDMEGKALAPALATPAGTRERAIAWVDTWEGGERSADAAPIDTRSDEAILERLRALGYLDPEGVPLP